MQNTFMAKGNLADSPKLKRINGANGEFVVASMRVMFGRYAANKSTGAIEQVGGFWHEVEIYGHKGEDVARLLRKGNRVLVVGEMRDFKARDEEGREVTVVKIVAEDVALVLSRVKSIEFEVSARRAQASGDAQQEQESAQA